MKETHRTGTLQWPCLQEYNVDKANINKAHFKAIFEERKNISTIKIASSH